jgi:membrane associated rhomboid family serine protease
MTTPTVTCYRHHDRRAGVTCQRCDRPICPDCMTQGSVGFHCPECIKAAAKTAPVYTARTLPTAQPFLTYSIIAVNVVVFVADVASGGTIDGGGGRLWEQGVNWGPVVAAGEWWRPLTSGFLHLGILHLLVNMFILFRVGPSLERRLGHLQFFALYAGALAAGSLAELVLAPESAGAGASGAVFGLLAAAAAYQHRDGINVWQSGLGVLIVINIAVSFVPGVSLWGHMGGLVVGGLTGWGMYELETRKVPTSVQTAFSVGLLAIWFAAVFASPVITRAVLL